MARVLIIDDSPTVSAAVSAALKYDGHDVANLSEFSGLGSILERFKPDVIVLDLLMPGFSGVQFARFVRRYSADPPPIVLHTGSESEMLAAASKEICPFDVVRKGSSERELRRTVARAATQRRIREVMDPRRSEDITVTRNLREAREAKRRTS